MNIQARDFSLTNALRSHVERRLRFAPGGDDLLIFYSARPESSRSRARW